MPEPRAWQMSCARAVSCQQLDCCECRPDCTPPAQGRAARAQPTPDTSPIAPVPHEPKTRATVQPLPGQRRPIVNDAHHLRAAAKPGGVSAADTRWPADAVAGTVPKLAVLPVRRQSGAAVRKGRRLRAGSRPGVAPAPCSLSVPIVVSADALPIEGVAADRRDAGSGVGADADPSLIRCCTRAVPVAIKADEDGGYRAAAAGSAIFQVSEEHLDSGSSAATKQSWLAARPQDLLDCRRYPTAVCLQEPDSRVTPQPARRRALVTHPEEGELDPRGDTGRGHQPNPQGGRCAARHRAPRLHDPVPWRVARKKSSRRVSVGGPRLTRMWGSAGARWSRAGNDAQD
jgi:hypothetical protein